MAAHKERGSRPVIYLAGPMAGLSWAEMSDWRSWAAERLPECEVRSPLRGKDFLSALEALPQDTDGLAEESARLAKRAVDVAISSQHAIVARDHWDVASSDVVLANFLGADRPSIGTCFELAWCWANRKPAVVVMDEGNPHDHVFVLEAAYVVVRTLAEGIVVVRQLLQLPPKRIHPFKGGEA